MGGLFGFGKKEETNDDGLIQDPPKRKPLTITFDRPQAPIREARGAGLYELTGQGKLQLNNSTLEDDDPNYQILAAIEESGNLSIGQISERAHLPSSQVEKYILGKRGLLRDGLVRRVGG